MSSNRAARVTSEAEVSAPWRGALLFGLVTGIVYLSTLSRNYTEAEDSLHYVVSVTSGDELFQPNHLLFNGICLLVFKAWQVFGYAGNALVPMQVLNAVAGATTICLIYRLGKNLGWQGTVAIAAALGCAGSYGFWSYSVAADTYILPLPFVLASLLLLVRLPRAGTRAVICEASTMGALLAVGTLIHQQQVLMFGAAAAGLWFRYRAVLPNAVRAVAALFAVGSATVAGTYLVIGIGVLGHTSLVETIAWARGHASGGLWTPWSWLNPIKGLIGLIRAILGLHFLAVFDWFIALMQASAPGKILVEEIHLAESTPLGARWTALVALVLSALAFTWLATDTIRLWLRQRFRGSVEGAPSNAPILWALFSAVLINGVFAVVWEPLNPEFWIATSVWFWLLLASQTHRLLQAGETRISRVFSVGVACLGITNLFGSIWPQSHSESDYWYSRNTELFEVLKPGDLLVTEGGYISNGYVTSMTEAQLLRTGRGSASEVERAIQVHEGRVLISSWATHPPSEIRNSDQIKGWDEAGVQALINRLEPRLRLRLSNDYQQVWELIPD